MKRIKHLTLILLVLLFWNLNAATPERKGWWKFNDPANLLAPEPGYPATIQLIGTHEAVQGPAEGNGAVSIGVGSYYKMQHSITANGGGNYVNEYSLQFDFKVPALSVWHAFFQTHTTNGNDADFFINPSGSIGVAAVGYSGYIINPNEWYRLIIAVKNPTLFTVYLDGKVLLEGNPQLLDDRFSLNPELLIFADEDGEDGPISCSEISIWDGYITADEAWEMGGYGHNSGAAEMALVPYLQSPGTNSMVVCWHDTIPDAPQLLFGTTPNLGMAMAATQEKIKYSYYWNTATLENLQPQTNYYYRLTNGSDTSATFVFKTLPDTTYPGKLRFLVLGDTHASDTTMAMKILKNARSKLIELYGINYQDSVQAIIHSGDVVVDGNSIDHYSMQYFKPMAPLTSNLGTMVVAGNHEGENPYFYRYLKLDSYSAFPDEPNLNEKLWHFRVANTLYIGLNTNITSNYGTRMANWLDSKLNEAEQNPSIDFVFLVFHHPPFSELWFDAITFDAGPNYVTNKLFPIIKKYSKVQQIHYGHTHGFERGTINSEIEDADFRIICGGGSGGPLDPWNEPAVHDYDEIHKTVSEYFFQIVEVDVASQSYQNNVYSLGNLTYEKPMSLLDVWYKKLNQPKPETPIIETIIKNNNSIQIQLSDFSGVDSLMSVQLQFFDGNQNNPLVTDTLIHWQNIFGIDASGYPVDKNSGINLTAFEIPISKLPESTNLSCKVRFRDHNLKWSEWSTAVGFSTVGILENKNPGMGVFLSQNYPNPFQSSTRIDYWIAEGSEVSFKILNQQHQQVSFINEGNKNLGNHSIHIEGSLFADGIYYYQLITAKQILTREMVKYSY